MYTDKQYMKFASDKLRQMKHEINEVLVLLGENTESVSNDTDESCVLHGVGDSHASEPTDKDNQSFVDGTLEIITDSGNSFMCKAVHNSSPCVHHCGDSKCVIYPKL